MFGGHQLEIGRLDKTCDVIKRDSAFEAFFARLIPSDGFHRETVRPERRSERPERDHPECGGLEWSRGFWHNEVKVPVATWGNHSSYLPCGCYAIYGKVSLQMIYGLLEDRLLISQVVSCHLSAILFDQAQMMHICLRNGVTTSWLSDYIVNRSSSIVNIYICIHTCTCTSFEQHPARCILFLDTRPTLLL